MNCLDPTQMPEGALLAYLEGEASPQIAAHLAHCSACRQAAVALRDTQVHIELLTLRAACPPVEALLGYQEALLAPAEAAVLATHLDHCAHCRAELAELTAASQERETLSLAERLIMMGRQLREAIRMPDPPHVPALAVRGAQPTHLLLYHAAPFQIVIAASPITGGTYWQIQGTLASGDDPIPQPALVSIFSAGQMQSEDQIDEFGYFHFDALLSGMYQLHIQLPALSIIIADMTIS
ncbi:hypothetical protein CJ255_15595 [Candidatus Viridilinea mediisalina]|uniref:Zinc-finger domain-containing protein n=2 Tax=Candidatus Viridilinea mediisalina TaxID=2024553 RepID=A0A2A6RGX9_9CHLR|nr:hypothetical protein CJ255_15595 [Candidatus Viridilinea mediisalina]